MRLSFNTVVIHVRPRDAINIRETKNVFERKNMLISRSYEVKLITCHSLSVRHSCGNFCSMSFSQIYALGPIKKVIIG